MESTSIHGGSLTFTDDGHEYRWNNAKVEHTVSGIAGQGYPMPFNIPAGWAAKMVRFALIEEMQKHPDGLKFKDVEDIERWARDICKAPFRKRDAAGAAGTTFHDFMERQAQGLEPDLPETQPERRSAEALRDWYVANIKRPISVERIVYHPELQYAGKLDLYAELMNGSTAVFDYKGVTDLKYPPKSGHVGQGAAYCTALALEGVPVDSFILMEVERDSGRLRVTQYSDIETEFEYFKAALQLVRYQPQGIKL